MTEQELIDLAWAKGRENKCGAVTLFCARDPSRKDGGWSSTYHVAYGAHACILDQIDLSEAWEGDEEDVPPDCEFSLVLCTVEVDRCDEDGGYDMYLRFVASAPIDPEFYSLAG